MYLLKLSIDNSPNFCGYNDYDSLFVTIDWPAIRNTAVEKRPTITTRSTGPLSIYDISGRLIDHATSKDSWKSHKAGVYLGRYPNGKAVKIVKF
jgi:hypothetical protein